MESHDAFVMQGSTSDYKDLATLLVHDFAQKFTAAQRHGAQQAHLADGRAIERNFLGAWNRPGLIDDRKLKKEWPDDQGAERKEWGKLLRLWPGDVAGSSHETGPSSRGKPSSK